MKKIIQTINTIIKIIKIETRFIVKKKNYNYCEEKIL